jgi:hypothetical protein
VAGRWFSPGTLFSSTSKTCLHNITDILLKVTLINITYAPSYIIGVSFISGGNCSTHWKPHSSPKSANFITLSSTPCHEHQILILNSDICGIKTVKSAHAFTFIKQSPVLKKVKLFFSCHRKFHMNWTCFKRSHVLKDHISLSQKCPLNTVLTVFSSQIIYIL